MGIWAKLGGAGLGIAGLVTGNPALIGAGASVIAADTAAGAASKASQQQVDAAEKAKAEANQRYDATRGEQWQVFQNALAGFAPYQQLGVGATGNLGQLTGIPMNLATNAPAEQVVPPALVDAATPASATPSLATPQTRAQQQTASGYGMEGKRDGMLPSSLGSLGGMVWVQAPTGERMRMPTFRAEQAVLKGAQIIG